MQNDQLIGTECEHRIRPPLIVAKFDFEDLCGQPLSAADYIEITKNFGIIFLLNIPKMDLNKKDLVCFDLK